MDIVDELRRSVWHEFVPTEKAADEIERLRRVEQAARQLVRGGFYSNDEWQELKAALEEK